ncbi:MAG: DUF2948 family protein [Pseudomonadota bacterium]
MTPLKLIAMDADDLAIVSAQIQDAVLKAPNLHFYRSNNRFVVEMNRFAWDAKSDGKPSERRNAVLHFDRVRAVRHRNIPLSRTKDVLNLLAVTFEAAEEPAGTVTLHFSGDMAIRLEVECIEARLIDLGGAWSTKNTPTHDISDVPETAVKPPPSLSESVVE